MVKQPESLTVRITSNKDSNLDGAEVIFTRESDMFEIVEKFYLRLQKMVKETDESGGNGS